MGCEPMAKKGITLSKTLMALDFNSERKIIIEMATHKILDVLYIPGGTIYFIVTGVICSFIIFYWG